MTSNRRDVTDEVGIRAPQDLLVRVEIWIKQCEAARRVEDEFGTQKALAYLIGEKLINFLEAAEDDADFRGEILAFIVEIKSIFEPWQLAEYLEIARQTEPFDPSIYEEEGDNPEIIEMERQDDIRRCAADLLLVEALNKVDVETVLIPVQCGGHGNFGTNEVAERMRQFFDKHLFGKDTPISGEPIKQGGR